MYKLRMFDHERISCSHLIAKDGCDGTSRASRIVLLRQGAQLQSSFYEQWLDSAVDDCGWQAIHNCCAWRAAEAKVFDANLTGNGWCTNRKGQQGGDITCGMCIHQARFRIQFDQIIGGLTLCCGGDSGGDYYSGGGSGHVTPAVYVTPLDGIKKRASLGPTQVTV